MADSSLVNLNFVIFVGMKDSTREEIENMVNAAAASFQAYRKTPVGRRAAFLKNIGARIEKDRNRLAEIAGKETSLANDRLQGEITRTINQCYFFADFISERSWVRAIIDTALPERKPLPRPDLRQIQQPLGPVAVFGASNFPFAYSVCGGDTVAAFAAGCPVVYKTNPGHPKTSAAVASIILEAAAEEKMPEGIFSIVYGSGHESGTQLVTAPAIKAVGFTGSFTGGRALFDAAAKRDEPIPVYAEMGSTNPVFILPKILEQESDELAKALAMSNTVSAGQFCTNPGIMVLHNSGSSKEFQEKYAAHIQNTAPAAMLTEGIFNNFEKKVNMISDKQNVSVLASSASKTAGKAAAYVFETSANKFLNDHDLWEEVFGPSAIQVSADGIIELLEVARALPGQITVSVWGTDEDIADHKELFDILELKAGRIIVNGVPTGVEVSPAMNHGGPYPATTDSKFTSVGTQSIYRFTRPVCYQNYPKSLLPEELRDGNPLGIWRLVNGVFGRE